MADEELLQDFVKVESTGNAIVLSVREVCGRVQIHPFPSGPRCAGCRQLLPMPRWRKQCAS